MDSAQRLGPHWLAALAARQIAGYRSVERTTGHVILSEALRAKSKNLRTSDTFSQIFGAKILRLALLAQDDRLGRRSDTGCRGADPAPAAAGCCEFAETQCESVTFHCTGGW